MTTTAKKTTTAVEAAIDGNVLVLKFAHGVILTVDSETLAPEIRNAAVLHGLKQKLVDAAAIGRDLVTGRTATIEDKYNAVREVYDRITRTDGTATWNKVRGGESTATPKGGLLVAAMMRITGRDHAAVTAYLDAMSKEQVAALRKNPRVVETIAAIQSERAKTDGVDSDALLDGLMSGEGAPNGGAPEYEDAHL